jgi:hypothetical protein
MKIVVLPESPLHAYTELHDPSPISIELLSKLTEQEPTSLQDF